MSSLNDDFKELMERIRHGREIGHASFEPIYYLVFSPARILDVKRQMPAWKAKLTNDGWQVHVFSITDQIVNILKNEPLRKIWLAADSKDPLNWKKTNESLANKLSSGALQNSLEQTLTELDNQEKSILLVTDLEALHPYMRIGAIEGKLQGKFRSPTVFFYPGERTGKTKLRFLGFYKDDGNYRSVHVGG